MESEWKMVALKEIAEPINTGLDAITRAPIVTYPTGIRCLRIQDISNNKRFDQWGFTTVRPIDYEKYQLKRGEIIMARTCSTGINYLVKEDLAAVFNNGLARIRVRRDVALPQFVYYVFQSRGFADYIAGISGGTSVQLNMKVGDLANYQFSLPPIDEQQAIAAVLGSLDDKIEQNRRTGAKLEGLARGVFKAWFVDFEPVKAKAAGATAFPGMPPETFAVLPTRLANSALGQVPEGWDVVTLPQFADVNYGKNLPANKLTQNGTAVYGAAGLVGYYSEMMFEQPVILITSRGSGSGAVHETYGPAFVTNNSFSVVPRESWISRHFLKYWLRSVDLLARVTGSAQPQLTLTNLQSLEVLNPKREMLRSFHLVADPLWELENANRAESAKLAALRDYLLPRLLSGRVRVEAVRD